MEFSSITGNSKYLESVVVSGFSRDRVGDNERFVRAVLKAIKVYNLGKRDGGRPTAMDARKAPLA